MRTGIQRYAFGLLSLLDAKTNGILPPELEDAVQSTVDLTQFYFGAVSLSTKSSDQLAQAITTNTAYALMTIPSGEAWQIVCVTGVVNNASVAVAALTATLNLGGPDGAGNTPVAKFEAQGMPNATKYLDAIFVPPPPQIYGPGTVFSVVPSETIAANADFHIRAAVRVMRA